LQLSLRSAFSRNERRRPLPFAQLVLRVEIERARIILPLICSLTLPLRAAAVAIG